MKLVKKATTLTDVAMDAGVSPYTASVVLNGSRSNTRVSEATRQRIIASAARLHYYPNAMARALLQRHAQTIGVLFGVVQPASIFSNEYATGLLQGIMEAAADTSYSVTIFTEPWVDAAHSAMRYRDGRTDGVLIVAPPGDCDILAGLAPLGLSLTVIAGQGPAYGIPSVDIDDREGARLAVDHLLQLGHSRIAHITGNANMPSAQARRSVFLSMMQEAGLAVPPEYVIAGRYNGETVAEAVAQLMSLPKPPTALFAGNDTIAVAAINALRERGLSIPADISIIGFDDMPISRLLTPPLTTIRQPLIQIGRYATRLLIDLAEGREAEPTERLVAPELVVRGTTGRPNAQ